MLKLYEIVFLKLFIVLFPHHNFSKAETNAQVQLELPKLIFAS